jgi:hypothetical protein
MDEFEQEILRRQLKSAKELQLQAERKVSELEAQRKADQVQICHLVALLRQSELAR